MVALVAFQGNPGVDRLPSLPPPRQAEQIKQPPSSERNSGRMLLSELRAASVAAVLRKAHEVRARCFLQHTAGLPSNTGPSQGKWSCLSPSSPPSKAHHNDFAEPHKYKLKLVRHAACFYHAKININHVSRLQDQGRINAWASRGQSPGAYTRKGPHWLQGNYIFRIIIYMGVCSSDNSIL